MDLSHLDQKYFLDGRRYNCPFCNRKSVVYEVTGKMHFNWSEKRTVFAYLVKCEEIGCLKQSLHLSDFDFTYTSIHGFSQRPSNLKQSVDFIEENLDAYFFYHQPTSFFTIDTRIHETLRKLISEAEGCLKMNYLVGASACLRKAIYELIELENAVELGSNGRSNYELSIKGLKKKFPRVATEYFDALSGVQELSSDLVHEGSWKEWTPDKLRDLIALTLNVLHELYVVPQEQKKRIGIADKLLSEVKKPKP